MTTSRFSSYAWFVLIYNIAVILWGAYVRATGSGAGCGGHWPLCNGVVLPRSPAIETMIEFSHRLMSGLALILVVLMLYWAWRLYPKGDRVRSAAVAAVFFIVLEALIGAVLVVFELVGGNTSISRALVGALHLLNTFLLLAALTLTARWSSHENIPTVKTSAMSFAPVLLGLVGVLLIGMSGAIAALGDTLFPPDSLAQGIAADLEPSNHFLIRLRVIHPILAVLIGLYLILFLRFQQHRGARQDLDRIGWWVSTMVFIQWLAGVVNLLLLAPIWMQIIHLLLADILWIGLIIFADMYVREPRQYQPAAGLSSAAPG